MLRQTLSRSTSTRAALRLASVAGWALMLTTWSSCGAHDDPSPGATGIVTLSLATVPSDVSCLKLTAAGASRTVVRALDASPGAPLTATVNGLPIGRVTLTAEAFSTACDSVTVMAAATWLSDPVKVTLAPAMPTPVALTMRRSGSISVGVDWDPQPSCQANGTACAQGTECCSGFCGAGLCQDPPDSGSPPLPPRDGGPGDARDSSGPDPGSDMTAPTLEAFSYAPAAIDTGAGMVEVEVTLTVTDDLAGFNSGGVAFVSPSRRQSRSCSFGRTTAKYPRSFTGTCTLQFPQYGEAGTWRVDNVYLYDAVGNYRNIGTIDLADRGLPTTLVITGTEDTTPPTLQAFSYTPETIETGAGGAEVVVTVTVADDLAGFNSGGVSFVSSSRQHSRNCSFGRSTAKYPRSFTGSCTLEFQQYGETGTWRVDNVYLYDAVGNYRNLGTFDLADRGLPTTLAVTGTEDTTAPTLAAFSYSPEMIDTGAGSAEVVVTLTVTDDLSGFNSGGVSFVSSSRQQSRGCSFGRSSAKYPRSFMGSCTVEYQQYGETGTWRVDNVYLYDAVGNYRNLGTIDLVDRGLPTTLVVAGTQ